MSSCVLYVRWSRDFRRGGIDRIPNSFVSDLSLGLCEEMTRVLQQEVLRVTQVCDIVPTDVDVRLDSHIYTSALRRSGLLPPSTC